MTGAEGAKVASAAAVGAGIPSLAMSSDEVVLLVALPIAAAWAGLVGVGLIEGVGLKRIFINLAGSVALGGVSGIVALALIEMTQPPAYAAMLISLTAGMGAITIAKRLVGAGGRIADTALGGAGILLDDDSKKGDE